MAWEASLFWKGVLKSSEKLQRRRILEGLPRRPSVKYLLNLSPGMEEWREKYFPKILEPREAHTVEYGFPDNVVLTLRCSHKGAQAHVTCAKYPHLAPFLLMSSLTNSYNCRGALLKGVLKPSEKLLRRTSVKSLSNLSLCWLDSFSLLISFDLRS